MSDKKTKKILLALPVMKGGGAERVAALLANEFYKNGIETSFLLTSTTPQDVIRQELREEIALTVLTKNETGIRALLSKCAGLLASVLCKPFEKAGKAVPALFAYLSFWSQYRSETKQLREIMKKDPELCVLAFLQPTVPMVLLAARGLPNRVVISERGDPRRLMKSRYGEKFIKKYYRRADRAVFQTFDAKNTYPDCVSGKGTVIPNPVKKDLPEPYKGKRNKNITTFCRISAQKNLPLLFEAFGLLHKEHPDYTLRIIGDSFNSEGERVERQIKDFTAKNGLGGSVIFEPFMKSVHSAIIKDAMYVNSSDYEGISNAMLESMAIGLPAVCTDCPIGGAGATIRDGENGMLVPVGDAQALYLALKKVIEQPKLAEKLSEGAAKIREEYSIEKISSKWIGFIWE
ncbi:MAG: glycosyltransferase [Clostridia bacterium]|nr:glycosyltransferase [Clostridia bacterium]